MLHEVTMLRFDPLSKTRSFLGLVDSQYEAQQSLHLKEPLKPAYFRPKIQDSVQLVKPQILDHEPGWFELILFYLAEVFARS